MSPGEEQNTVEAMVGCGLEFARLEEVAHRMAWPL